ncbi:pheromone-regulated protein PRM10 [Sugiyamaella lignohabitans]|uniref:Pheromone-regulated protein PRM10 n=1 Tax=Sugiyamaella lignohabitans TaxID=796027 RepID=A0A167FMC3_9ASCO|nr:pheromone-regulated protein PRM10 [Sugiyamaella lignohabitans]ANB15476.1 pheromone-regulated protein PRM10 [Sugiyamaella lignohabitans]
MSSDKTSPSPGSESNDDSSKGSTPTSKAGVMKSKNQRVRFPADNNPLSRVIHYPNGDESPSGSPFSDPSNSSSSTSPTVPVKQPGDGGFTLKPAPKSKKRLSSPLASPPIVVQDHDQNVIAHIPTSSASPTFSSLYAATEDRHISSSGGNNDGDYFTHKSPTYVPSKHRDSEVLQMTTLANTLYNRSSNAQLDEVYDNDSYGNDGYDSEGDIQSRRSYDSRAGLLQVPEPAITASTNPLQHVLDVGNYTSGGLAPGAVDYEEKSNRGYPHSANDSIESSPYLNGEHMDGDIQLLNLDKKLQDLKDQTEALEAAGEAETLVRSHTVRNGEAPHPLLAQVNNGEGVSAPTNFNPEEGFTVPNSDFLQSVVSGREEEEDYPHTPPPDGLQTPRHEDYISPPSHVKLGILGSLLKLYGENEEASKSNVSLGGSTLGAYSEPSSAANSPPSGSGSSTPIHPKHPRPKILRLHSSEDTRPKSPKWYKHKHHASAGSLGDLVMSASQTLAAPGIHTDISQGRRTKQYKKQPGVSKKKQKAARLAEQIRITVHIADVLQRQRFILRMCRALMMFGAPTHRLEEYMKMTSRVLEIDGQFLYIPGCMITSFGDPTTHTSEMHLVRVVQGLNLNKLQVVHQIYKEVVHDIIGVQEASTRLDDLVKSKNMYPRWLCIMFFALASAFFSVLSFGGRWIDFPISMVLGGLVGFLQIWIAPRSDLYSNVFEVTSSILVSFLARAFGSIGSNQDIFCFAAIAQGSLALILPGYIILCGSLELQSKNIVAGAVRMFYAVIYACKY